MLIRPILCLLLLPLAARAGDKVSFNRDIRPILSDKCFHCHGPDEKERKSKLRMDGRESALKGGESGDPAIVPGKPAESELIRRVLSKDRDEVMPPPKLHKPVSAQEAELLRRWVAEGAEYQGHWAFIKPERVEPPVPAGNPIDGFILKKLTDNGMKLSPPASKETLIRRVTLDLTGLPPTSEEVAAFVKDAGPGAYERLVDRLLTSPRYGEQMAARWLDLARYADSNGFQTDSSRSMWPWRDWVIRAFNANMPFDEFTIEQLAGDLLPNATRDQIVATGFNRNCRLNGEGGRIVEEWFAETVIDRVETTGQTWMALTVGCSRCHDHKYDPITQKEFYQLFSYFNSNDESGVIETVGGNRAGGNTPPFVTIPTRAQEAQEAVLKEKVTKAEAGLKAAEQALPGFQPAWEKTFRQQLNETLSSWKLLQVNEVKSVGGATFTQQPDASWLASGMNPADDTYEIDAKIAPGKFTGLLLEVMPDASLPTKSLGRAANGNFVLSAVEAEINVPGKSEPIVAAFKRAEADYEQKEWTIAAVIDGKKKRPKGAKASAAQRQTGWAVDGNLEDKRIARKALFVCDPLDVPEGATLTVRLIHGSPYGDHNIGRFRLSATSLPPATVKIEGAKMPQIVRTALLAEPAKRSPQQKTELANFFRENGDHPAKKAAAEVAAAKKAVSDLSMQFETSMVFKEVAAPRPAFVLKRGEYDKPGDPVARALPAFLPPMPAGAPNDRLGLAKWLVSGEHPLTARVWVNRAWEKFFANGLVKTTENLGSQSEWPSHPEMLDWLATEFVRLKWDMKAMQRLMVTSAAYRQSARVTPEILEKDPENRLLSRAPRIRLPAEAMRDQALAISGLLAEKLGGPSVRPYMPPAVWDETSVYGDMRGYKQDTGDSLYRRTLYTIWKRTAAPPTMLLFDSPNREICTVKRSRTNTPLQALVLLNETTYVEAARHLAERMLKEGGATPAERIAWAFERATARKPDAFELRRLTSHFDARLATFMQDAEAAAKLIAQGASKPDATLDPAQLAACTVTANVILNLDEVVTRE